MEIYEYVHCNVEFKGLSKKSFSDIFIDKEGVTPGFRRMKQDADQSNCEHVTDISQSK